MMKRLAALAAALAMLMTCTAGLAEDKGFTDLVFTQIEAGPIVGFNYKGSNTFRGVPYAQAIRYQAPQKTEPWTETRSCINYGLVCYSNQNSAANFKFTEFMTPSNYSWIQGEDCQNLNIWTPSMDKDAKLPVLVFLHGGGGNAQELDYYDGTNISVSGNLVFVSINHREATLGSLDLSAYGEEYINSAYCQYLDIIAALEWIRDNIATFGGDPSNVTMMGQSAGTNNLQTLMAMPASWGLFHKVVLSAGADMRAPNGVTHEETQAQSAKVVEELGLTPDTIGTIAEIPYAQLDAAVQKVGYSSYGLPADGFYPEPVYVDGVEIEANKQIPMLVNTTYSEFCDNFAGQVQGVNYETMYKPGVTEEMVMELLRERYGDAADQVVEKFRKAYPQKDLFYALYINTTNGSGRSLSVAKMRAENGGVPVYASVQCYEMPLFGGVVAVHTNGDLPYMFNNTDKIDYQLYGDEEMAQKVAAEFSTALANFCRSGNPNGEGVPEWPAFTSAQDGAVMFWDRESSARSYVEDADLIKFMNDNLIKK